MLHDSKYRIIFAVPNIYANRSNTYSVRDKAGYLSRYDSLSRRCLATLRKGSALSLHTNISDLCQTPLKAVMRGRIVSALHITPFLSTVRRKTAQSTSTTQLRQSMPRKQSAVPSMRAASITSAYLSIWNPLS